MAKLRYTYRVRRKLADGTFKDYWRFRRGDRNSPLPGQPGDADFFAAYAEILDQEERIAETKEHARHTFDWLCDQYVASPEFTGLAQITQDDYQRTIDDRLRPVLGVERYDAIKRKTVKTVRDSYASQPRTAHKIKQMVSRLYTWADENDLLPAGFENPATRIKKLKSKVKHIQVWSDEEVDLFLSRCEPFMVTPVLLALYTGQRREDLVQMTWADYHGGIIRVRQNKTGEPLDIPAHKRLREHLDRIRSKFGGAIVRAANGRPLNANALSSALTRAMENIPDMPHRSWHGLRYAAAGRMEEAGCTIVMITSVIGHRTYQMAMQYISQRRAAQAGMELMEKSA